MKEFYEIKSDRYGHTHKFIETNGNNYIFKPAESWMPIYLNFDPATKKIVSFDTEGGPFMTVGWHNDEIRIKEIYQVGTVIFFILEEINEEN